MRYSSQYALIYLLVLFGLPIQTAAQTTFNVVQHHPSTLSYNGAVSVFEQPDGYLVFSRGWSLDSTSSGVHIAKFDLEGNILWLKEHRREFDVSIGYIDPVTEIPGNRYVASILEFGNGIPNSSYLYWFNAEGDTIRTRFFKSDSASTEGNHGGRQLVALPDGGFLHCGWCSDPVNTGCITRLDSSGGILWERLYTNTNTILKATPLADGGFILGGTRNGQLDKAVVMRTDSSGVVQWTKYQGLYSTTAGTQAMVDGAGNVLSPGSWNPDPAWTAYDRWASVYKYAPGGTLLERKDYMYNRSALALHALDKGSGHTWLVGSTFQYGVDPAGVMLLWELDESLDSLWMRRYWYYGSRAAENFMYSVRSTSDGGLVMCGMTKQGDTDSLPHMQSNWLLKLDAYGCLVPGCHTVGVQDHELGLQQSLRISPNPANGQVQITLHLPEGYRLDGAVQAVVLDAQGREVLRQRVSANTMELRGQVDVAGLPAGLYFLHLRDVSKWLAGGKVMVE